MNLEEPPKKISLARAVSFWAKEIAERGMLIVYASVLIQLSTWHPIHGLKWDISLLLILECASIFILATILNPNKILFLAISFFLTWKFAIFLVPFSWFFASIIHLGASFLAEGFGLGIGISTDAFRINGFQIAADPTKTASFALIFLAVQIFIRSLLKSGLRSSIQESLVVWPSLLVYGIIRWLAFASILGWWRPDLVAHGWQIFWGIGLLASLLPVLSFRFSHQIERQPTRNLKRIAFAFLLTGGIFLIVRCFSFSFIQTPKVKVLIDETHSQWEPTIISPEMRKDPVLAENNYSPWLSLLRQLASVSVLLQSSDATLAAASEGVIFSNEPNSDLFNPDRFDLVILKCPTRPYSPSEAKILQEYVWNGGTLWAIGEHTNVFFMNTYLNQVIEPISSSLSSDGVCDHMGRWLVTGGPLHAPLPFGPSHGLYMWATGASIKPDLNLIPLAVSSPDAFSDPWEPQNRNFFGNLRPDNSHLYGPFVLAGMLHYGKGKIIIHGDSTNFNSSMLSTPGKIAFTQRILKTAAYHGLNANLYVVENILLALLFCLGIGMFLRSNYPLTAWCFTILLYFSLGFCTIQSWHPEENLSKKPLPTRQLAIDYSLQPTIGLSYDEQGSVTSPDSLDALFIQLQHENLRVFTSGSGFERILSPDISGILLAEPALMPTPEAMNHLKQWVHAGGTLIMVSRKSPTAPLRSIALYSGLQESSTIQENGFYRLVSKNSKPISNPFEIQIEHHSIGAGGILIVENWGGNGSSTDGLIFLAGLISRNISF